MLSPVQPGQRIAASTVNEIIARVTRGMSVRGGPGIEITREGENVVVSLAKILGEQWRPARIESRTGNDPDRADRISYTVREMSTENRIINVTPHWGRPTRRPDVLIAPAPIGGLCWIVRDPQADGSFVGRLWLPAGGEGGEVLHMVECGQQVAGVSGGASRRVVVRNETVSGPAVTEGPSDAVGGDVGGVVVTL